MYSESKPVVHLVDISQTNEPQKPDSGVVHHVAFASQGLPHEAAVGVQRDGIRLATGSGGDLWQISSMTPMES